MGNRLFRRSPAPPMEEPWRSLCKTGQAVKWDEEMEKALRAECLRSDLQLLGQRQVRILVLGLTGSGKSSFINSLYCALLDRVDQYVHTEALSTTVTPFLCHPPLRIGGKEPYFRIQDAPGIMEAKDDFYTDFVTLALQGHLKEDVQLPSDTIPRDAEHYVEFPGLMDRPCLVVFVLGSLPLNPQSVLKRKLDIVIKHARLNKIKLALVLTKADLLSADEERPLKNADVQYTFHSKAALTAVNQANEDTGITEFLIFPVTNYKAQTETCTQMNVLHLYTLSKLLHFARLEGENRLETERATGTQNPD